MKLVFTFLFFLAIQSCKSPIDTNKFCDHKSKGYKLELLRRISVNDKSAYCQFPARTDSQTINGSPPLSGTLSSDFASATSLAPILISKDRVLSFTNSLEMGTSCELKFNTTVLTPLVRLSADKKTISLTPPTSGWPLDVENIINLQFQNCKTATGADVTLSGAGIQLYVAEKVIYVESISGLDTNAGTTAAPMKSISTALTSATTGCTDRCAIAVKGGTYTISSSINMPTNISIFGGFDPADWTKRRADKTMLSPYDTILNDTSTNINGTGANPYGSIKFDTYTGTKSKTIIDGVVVNGATTAATGSFSAVISTRDLTASGGITLRNSIFNDIMTTPGPSVVTSAGFVSANNSGTIIIDNCTIKGSTVTAASTTRYGIVYNIFQTGSSISVSNSEIDGGISTATSSGVLTTGATKNGNITLTKNTIKGPTCSGCDSIGIQVDFATANGMTISENTITASAGANSYGINSLSGTGLSLTKNIITAGTATTNSTAVRIATSGGTSLTASENTINSSSAQTSQGVELSSGSNILFDKNIINVGAGTTNTKGIIIPSGVTSPVTISNNTLNVGTSTTTGTIYGIEKGLNGVTLNINTNIINMASCGSSCGVNRGLQLGGGGGTGSSNLTNNTINCGSGSSTSCVSFNNDSSYSLINNNITGAICAGASCISYGLEMSFGGSATLTNNTVRMPACIGTGCSQIAVRSGNGLNYDITGNTFDSGPSSANTSTRVGMSMENWGSGSSIQRNTIISRSGVGTPIAVDFPIARSNSIQFCSNVVIGGGRTNAGSAHAIQLHFLTGNAKFMGNTIIVPTIVSGGIATAVNFTQSGTHTGLKLDQNIFFGNGPLTNCVNEVATANYATLAKNSFTACSGTFYRENATNFDTLCTGNFGQGGCGTLHNSPSGMGNVTNNILTTDFTNFAGNDLRLLSTTHTNILNGMGASDLTVFNTECGNSLDRDGATRTAGTALGAYK